DEGRGGRSQAAGPVIGPPRLRRPPTSAQEMRILVVEDERKVASFIRQGLEEEGHAVETAADGAAALDLVLAGPAYDLVVLDLMLPKRDGFGVLKTLRDRGVGTPVLDRKSTRLNSSHGS